MARRMKSSEPSSRSPSVVQTSQREARMHDKTRGNEFPKDLVLLRSKNTFNPRHDYRQIKFYYHNKYPSLNIPTTSRVHREYLAAGGWRAELARPETSDPEAVNKAILTTAKEDGSYQQGLSGLHDATKCLIAIDTDIANCLRQMEESREEVFSEAEQIMVQDLWREAEEANE
ncbi:MAG: hypothetical protein Q9157_000681 [Trypethelium eluteriae]